MGMEYSNSSTLFENGCHDSMIAEPPSPTCGIALHEVIDTGVSRCHPPAPTGHRCDRLRKQGLLRPCCRHDRFRIGEHDKIDALCLMVSGRLKVGKGVRWAVRRGLSGCFRTIVRVPHIEVRERVKAEERLFFRGRPGVNKCLVASLFGRRVYFG